jgi:hypothetical protein
VALHLTKQNRNEKVHQLHIKLRILRRISRHLYMAGRHCRGRCMRYIFHGNVDSHVDFRSANYQTVEWLDLTNNNYHHEKLH